MKKMTTKEEVIANLVKAGMTETDAKAAIAAITPAPVNASDFDAQRKINMLEGQVETREKQLRQAIDIANRANDAQKAKDEAERLKLIESVQMDSKFTKDDLKDKSLAELQTMRITLDKSIEKTFASVAAEIDEQKRVKQPLFTVGYYDSKTQTFKGGIM